MADSSSTHVYARDWRLTILVGISTFASCNLVLQYLFPPGKGWIAPLSPQIVGVALPTLAGMLAMALTLSWRAAKLRSENLRMRVAVNNMSQGLCMFDRNERLVVCNQRYMEMYRLSSDIVKPGCS